MPRLRLTKSAIDALPTPVKDLVYWDTGSPGFGIKVTPKGRKVFIVLYRAAGAGSRLRKYTIGPYGRITLHQARVAAQRIFAQKLEGRDPAAEKREASRRIVADQVEDLLEAYISQHVSQNRSAHETSRMLRREIGSAWRNRSIHDIGKRDVIAVVSAIEQRGTPIAANKALKGIKTFLRWCVGRAVLDQSPADGVPLPAKEVSRDRVLGDEELVRVILAARKIRGPYGGLVELLALTGQRRAEAAGLTSDEIDYAARLWTLSNSRTKNGKSHAVHLSNETISVLKRHRADGAYVFSVRGDKPFLNFSQAKRELDALCEVKDWCLHDLRRTCVSGMARLGVPPHVADKVLNHQNGAISGVAAVYQRHDFMSERKAALDLWGRHITMVLDKKLVCHQTFQEAAE